MSADTARPERRGSIRLFLRSRRMATMILSVLLVWATGVPSVSGLEVRIKDVARIDGLSPMDLLGYGIVVGLRGTGDKDIELTKRTVANILQNFNIALPTKDIKSKNVAVVMVTAVVPPFHRPGDRVNVQVSSIGDAVSLEGGILLMTPLLDPAGELFGVAQGAMVLGGYSAGVAGPGGMTESKGHTTVGIVPGGGTLRKSGDESFVQNGILRLILRHPDFTTATRMADAINAKFEGVAQARDAGSVMVRVPQDMLDIGQSAQFVANLETLSVRPDQRARVIVNERTGTIVMGADVRISEALVAHGSLTVNIDSTLSAYMPRPFTRGVQPVVLEDAVVRVQEEEAKILQVPTTTTVRELADVLNQMGATPRDLISILEALQRLGALQMEIVTM